MNKLHILFGGTFDPIHYGHLLPALTLAKELDVAKITLMPNNIPPHRPQPEASSQQRLAMLKLAISGEPLLGIDEYELQRPIPSFTIETLKEIRQQKGAKQPLAFIMGQDTLLGLPSWSNWQTILNYCHLIICNRPGYPHTFTDPTQQAWLDHHTTSEPLRLSHQANGLIYFANTPQLAISATEIRRRLAEDQPLDDLLPNSVLHYIKTTGLYKK